MMVYQESLAETIDALNEAFFLQSPPTFTERDIIAKLITSRQGLKGSYAGMFAPTEKDFKEGVRLFTGEKLTSKASIAHIIGEESCRALLLLKQDEYKETVGKAFKIVSKRLIENEKQGHSPGIYCCGKCSVGLWRHLLAGKYADAKRRLEAGIKALKELRDGKGRWEKFPFYYTLLALNEMDFPAAIEEMRYSAPILEKFLKRKYKIEMYVGRRIILAEKVLTKC